MSTLREFLTLRCEQPEDIDLTIADLSPNRSTPNSPTSVAGSLEQEEHGPSHGQSPRAGFEPEGRSIGAPAVDPPGPPPSPGLWSRRNMALPTVRVPVRDSSRWGGALGHLLSIYLSPGRPVLIPDFGFQSRKGCASGASICPPLRGAGCDHNLEISSPTSLSPARMTPSASIASRRCGPTTPRAALHLRVPRALRRDQRY